MYRVELDKDNYLLGFYKDEKGKYDFNPLEMNLKFKNCYKLVDGKFILDEVKKQAIEDEDERLNELSSLKQFLIDTSDSANDFVEELFALDNPLTFISDLVALIVSYRTQYKTILAQRKQARERIKELEK